MVSKAEEDLLTNLVNTASLTPKARFHLETFLETSSNPSNKTGFGPNQLKISHLNLNEDGYPTERGRVTADAWVNCPETLAELYRDDASHLLQELSLLSRSSLLENAISELHEPTGSNAAQRRQVRSSAFTTIFALASSLPNTHQITKLKKTGVKELLNAARQEPNQRLTKHMLRLLLDPGFQTNLTHTQKRTTLTLH